MTTACRGCRPRWARCATGCVATQQRLGVGPAATCIAGFSQGAILGLELSSLQDGLVGRVLAFGGRYAQLPAVAPRLTTLHLLHGGDDAVIAAGHAREALQHLGVLQGDATLDIAKGVGHVLHPALIDSALFRLQQPHPAPHLARGHGRGARLGCHADHPGRRRRLSSRRCCTCCPPPRAWTTRPRPRPTWPRWPPARPSCRRPRR